METTSAKGWRNRLTPGVVIAAAAGGVGFASACGALLLWRAEPFLLVPALLLSPLLVAASAWLAARHAIRSALAPAVAAAERLAASDFSQTGTGTGPTETRALLDALGRAREAAAARDRTARAHAAVAKLMGAGIGRLAQGDFSARLDVVLPAPYDGFGRDFNAAMERIGARADMVEELGAAAARLDRRARKLEERIGNDLRIIEALARRDAAEGLAVARHTMEGVGVATRRNVEAAGEFARLAEALRPPMPEAEEDAGPEATPDKVMAA